MKIVVTVVGKDRVGIIAMVSTLLAENGINILHINQNIVAGFFNMVLIADLVDSKVKLVELQENLRRKGMEIGMDIKVQHEAIFDSMHRI